ncbi:hypothetical protein RND71_033040 [Anisodus tanguticus]|uniref:Lysosomal Pro-X carboxypeptidase n=1 Tax=Anisodus tanguticus TaxID=243964 RepID=A0AAE1R8I6_9SOLA|nr:hypothetical protein RND71_033040 [Anisodus tanguticus]
MSTPWPFLYPVLILIISFLCQASGIHLPSKNGAHYLGNLKSSSKTFSLVANSRAPKYQYETKYFQQKLDHFSFAYLPSFPQRYLINTQHWVGPSRLGPIFLYCGNEGDIEWFASNTGFVWEIAPRFGAMVIFPEHRYYGESMPHGSKEEAYKNATTLSYLTAEQAIADYAVLITELKRNLSAQACPVVLFGGSYGGMLAAWMRLKYPHISIGALASSAPVLQFEDLVPPETFYNIVSNDFRRESMSCFNTIKESWDVINKVGQINGGLAQLTKTFHICRELESVDDLSNWLDSAYSYLAMANYPYPTDFLMPLPGSPIKEVSTGPYTLREATCIFKIIINHAEAISMKKSIWVSIDTVCRKVDSFPDGSSVLQRIFEGISVYYNYTGKVDCFNLDDDPHGMSGWDWQACTEMIMPMASNRTTSMFPEFRYDPKSDEEQCLKEFNVKPRPTWITTEFGGHAFKSALKAFGSNIIFSNGLLDPWSGGSVLEDVSETIVALITEKDWGKHIATILSAIADMAFSAHHLDLRAATAEDPDWLLDQRSREIKLISEWLDEYYDEKKATFSM